MEILIYALFGMAAAILVVMSVQWHRRIKKRKAHDALLEWVEAAAKLEAFKGVGTSEGPFVRSSRLYRDTRRFYNTTPAPAPTVVAPAPTVVREDNTGSLLMAGAVGYMLASSGHAQAAEPMQHRHEPDLSCRPSDGEFGGAGASSSYASSSSSESSSSYDSGSSSSDSGSSSRISSD